MIELDRARVCAQRGTTTLDNLADFFAVNRMRLAMMDTAAAEEPIAAYEGGRCTVLTSDLSQLYALRLRLAKPRDHAILSDVISNEPLGPVVRNNDRQWIDFVRWVHFAMLNAEELEVGSKTINQALASRKPR